MDTKTIPIKLVTGISLACLFSASILNAEPITLDDLKLNAVTAGTNESATSSGSGGAIIGNSSSAIINQTGGVELDGEAQAGADALNLVNTAESTVANGVNIWDGKSDNANIDNSELMVDQSNVIAQEQRRSASMPNYSRPEANTFIDVERTGNEVHNDSMDRNNNIVDLHSLTSDAHNESFASVDTTIQGGGNTNAPAGSSLPASPDVSFDTNVGKGLAIAGQLSSEIDGGEVQIGLAVGGAVIAYPDAALGDSYGGMDIGDEDSEFVLYGRLILPEITIDINGAGCGVAMGSCVSEGVADLTTSEITDDSIMDTEVVTSEGNSQFSEKITETYRSPFELNDAQAEYIVVDDSSLTVNTNFTLALSGSAQSNASGMNVVNATGSAVANGINIARTSGLTNNGAMALQQSNVISHSR